MNRHHIKKILSGSLLGSLLLVAGSCSDFLNEEPKKAITEEQMYSDPEYVESNLIDVYSRWRNYFTDRYAWEVWIGTDEIQSGAYQALKESGGLRGSMDAYNSLLTSDLSWVADQWTGKWLRIGEAAKMISALGPKADEDAFVAQLFGEASFIRGSMCMELTMMYGRIPILDIDRALELGYARQPLEDVWTYIIDDLSNAAKYLPETNNPGRATKYAANMMLGYAYMAAPVETGLRNFSAARDALAVIVNSGRFSLPPYYDLWDYNTPNTSESIFEWQFDNYTNQNKIEFQIGSRCADAISANQCYFAGYDHAVPTQWAYSDVEDGGIWEPGDVRKEESLRYDFTWNGEEPTYEKVSWEGIGDDHDELLPHIKKYEDFRTDLFSGMGLNNMWYSGKNIPWLRYANVLLLYAECLNELGSTGEAVQYVNQVRTRAWDGNLPANMAWNGGMSQSDFRDNILTERVRELFGERWRRFDLVRTGRFVELVKARNKWAARSGTIQEFNTIWPIPQSEIDQNDDISLEDQNEGYR